MLTPRLDTVEALFRKLKREFVRAYHHSHVTHKADHFYNFCITAQSLRDFYLERIGKASKHDRRPFELLWSKVPVVVAVADIANSAKHFQLREPGSGSPRIPRTRKVGAGKTSAVDLYVDDKEKLHAIKRTGILTLVVTLGDGFRFELYSFMEAVLEYWRVELANIGIKVRRQTWKALHGKCS